MESLNNKINSTQEDSLFQAQAVGVYGYNATDKKMKAGHVTDANELKVAVSQHLVDGPDMKARSDIADPATSTFVKCNADGTLEMTAELDSSNLAKEANQVLQLAQETITALNTTDITTATQDISNKMTVGIESILSEAQQVGIYGSYNDTDLRPLKVDFNGRLMTQVDGVRANGSNTFTIPAGTTAESPEILMGQHTYIAFYGDTDNTTDTTIRIEYSNDGVNWFRGNGDNAKIIVVGSTGNFYDEEHVTPPRVRLSKNNTTASLETISYYHTRL